VGGATGPMTIGHLYDRAGSYSPVFIAGLACVSLLATIVSLFLVPSKMRDFVEDESMTPGAWQPVTTGQEN
jgi:cyanate permease